MKLVRFLQHQDIDYLLVNATNKWLDEMPNVKESAVYTLTNFSGDTGEALLTKDGKILLFVDGRYHIQAEKETKGDIEIVKLNAGQKFDDEIVKTMFEGAKLAVVSSKISLLRYMKLKEKLDKKNIKLLLLKKDPINNYTKRTSKKFKKVKYNVKKFLLEENMLITNLEDVSYLTGLRNFKKDGSSKIYAKLFLDKNGKQILFTNQKKLEHFIVKLNKRNDKIAVDKTISLYDFNLIKNPVIQNENKILTLRTIKTDDEIFSLQQAFEISNKALLATRQYIENSRSGALSEYDIYTKLVNEFYKNGAVGLSFNPIVAINKNSSQAHYSIHAKDVYLKDGDLVLIDCGVYGSDGLATDTTRVFVKGNPTRLQIQVYTLVLKAFLNAYSRPDMNGYELNDLAHEILDKKIGRNGLSAKQANIDIDVYKAKHGKEKLNNTARDDDFFVFNHGLGHGIGISVHEVLPSLSKSEYAKQQILDNMCFTIEPGLYHKDFFGIRLENSFYRKNKKNISFVKVGFEKKLIDFDLLANNEKELLTQFGTI